MQKSQPKRRTPVPAAATVSLNTFVLLHLRFLQFFGLCPISLQHIRTIADVNAGAAKSAHCSDKCQRTWMHIHIGFFAVAHCVVVYHHTYLLFNGDSFGKFNDVLKLSGTMLAHFVTLFETLLRRRQMQQFLQIYSKLHGTWSKLSLKAEACIYRRWIFNLVLYLAVMVAVEMTYIIEIRHRSQWALFYLSYMPSVFICRFRVLQFNFYLELLRLEVERLNTRILRLVVVNRRLQKDDELLVTLYEQEICAEIHKLMVHYDELYRMTELLKSCTAWSMVTNYAVAYFKILSDCYWSIWVVYHGEDVIEFTLVLPTALNIFQLLVTARNCMYSSKYLAHNIHKLRHAVENVKIAARIQNFSLQLMHQQIIIEANGFFVINCNMARDVLGSITTYMIFFVQFMPKFNNI